jgi:outer membrane protein insertion porin family
MKIKKIDFFSLIRWAAMFCACACPAAKSMAAADPTVGSVAIRSVGPMPINGDAISSLIRIKEGGPFRQELNDDSIRAIYATKLFDLVEVRTDGTTEDGKISISYVLYPKARIGNVSFSGNAKLSSRRLRRLISIDDGAALDWSQVQKDVDAIRNAYLNCGYADIEIAARSGEEKKDGTAVDLVFEITEGKRLPISKISFSGNDSIESKKLLKVITTKRRGLLSFLNGSGFYRSKQISEDLEQLRKYYRNNGFLDVTIDEKDITLERPKGRRLAVTIGIVEGQRFRIGNISFAGNELKTSEALQKRLKIGGGDYFSPDLVDGSAESIRYLYGRDGYIDTVVSAQRRANLADNSIDVTFAVKESGPCKVGMVHIQGNTKSKNNIILRELSISPGDKFNLIKLRNSENRLRETRYFSRVALIPEYVGEADTRDVLVSVEEAKTGRFYLGGAMSSIDNMTAFIEFGQSNFDISKPSTAFQGAGQKFRTRAEFGTRTSNVSAIFEEPWLFDRELAFGVDIFFWRNEHKHDDYNYSGGSYNERHGGTEVYFRKRIVELLEGRVFYRIDKSRLYDVGMFAPQALREQEAAGGQWISKTGLTLERDSRDSLLYPTVGNRLSFEIDYAGIGGDVHYINLDLQAGQWFPTFKLLTQTICFIAKAGAMKEFRHCQIPYFDRKFLGGPNDMRGFDVQAVGPRDVRGVPIGARTYAYGCAEYCLKLAEQFRIALFSNCAYVGREFCKLDKPFYLDAGAELRIFVMGSPLRLIFGYPIRGDQFKEHHINFNFTFGTIF